MHIAFVIDLLGGYGGEHSVYRLVRGLSERGHRVDVIPLQTIIHRHLPRNVRVFLLGGAPDRLTEERSAHVLARAIQLRPPSSSTFSILRLAQAANALHWDPRVLPGRRLLRQARAVASYLDVEKPDCVLPNLYRSMCATYLGGRMTGECPPVMPMIHGNLHESLSVESYRFRLRVRYLFSGATHFVAVSQGVSDSLANAVGVPREKITTIYNPVVTPDLDDKAVEIADHPWFRDDGAPVLLAVGRLEKEKDYPTLIRAFARLAARRSCRLIILGEGSQRTETEGLIEEFKLTDRVSLPGWVENPFAFMARASLFVLSSRWEGLPTVLVEAMACGCPCVSTDCPSGPAEILQDGEFGVLVPVGDSEALAEAMERVLDDPPDRRLLQQRAAYFSADRAVAAYEDLIASVVRRSGRT